MPTALVLTLQPEQAQSIALADGLPASELHCTLAVWEQPLSDEQLVVVRHIAQTWANCLPFGAILNGICRFVSGDPNAVVLTVDCANLSCEREELCDALCDAGIAPDSEHGFVPHVTLMYVTPERPTPGIAGLPMAVEFAQLELWDDNAHTVVLPVPSIECSALESKTVAFGHPVHLSALPTSEAGRWNVLAYESTLTIGGKEITLTKRDFEQCVANFARYPKVPIVLEHADTLGDRPPSWAESHGYVTELRVGTFTRPSGKTVASLEGRLVFDAATASEVNSEPPKWPFGSITILFNVPDEETKRNLGSMLWSFSLTTHPRLIDVPRLVASMEHSHHKENDTMFKFLELAVKLGLSAANEDDAQQKIASFAMTHAESLKALNIAPTASSTDVVKQIATLSAQAARVPALETRVADFERKEKEALQKQRETHLSAVLSARPELQAAKSALTAYANSDFEAFAKEYPMPSHAELSQRAQDGDRFTRIAGDGKTAPTTPAQGNSGAQMLLAAMKRVDDANNADPEIIDEDELRVG